VLHQRTSLTPAAQALDRILRAQGWTWRDRLSLLRAATGWQLSGFTCAPQTTVAELCAPLTRRLLDTFIEPLCVSALNTPAAAASGAVFLRVLRDALFGAPGSSNLLLPTKDLSALFPQAAADWLRQRGHTVHLGHRVRSLTPDTQGPAGRWLADGEPFDRVILATSASDAAHASTEWSLHAPEPIASSLRSWAAATQALHHEAITTVYALAASGLTRPMLALPATAQHPAQFVFDRGQLGGPRGLLAFVISASTGEREALQRLVVAQAREQLGLVVEPLRTITENAPPSPVRRACSARPWRSHRGCWPVATTSPAPTRPRSKAPCAAAGTPEICPESTNGPAGVAGWVRSD
jgi:hypothetical protein